MATQVTRNNRAAVWNTLVALAAAHLEAAGVSTRSSKAAFDLRQWELDPAPLDAKKAHALAALVLLNVAAEARVNHLLLESLENCRRDSRETFDMVTWGNTARKWKALPRMYGKGRNASWDGPPHDALFKLLGWRNTLMHAKFLGGKHLSRKSIPAPEKIVWYLQGLWHSMELLNVRTGRIARPRSKVLKQFDKLGRGTPN